MLLYKSIKGGSQSVDFERAILDGYASDGGLYVPESLPNFSKADLEKWKALSYQDLAFEILTYFIDKSIVSDKELKEIISTAYSGFEKDEIIPLHKLESRNQTYVMELFYGPTLSFKDIGMAFLVTLVNFFLKRKKERLSIIVATTGDTGPAAAHFISGKSNLDAWVLYPKGLITEEQERQMTTLPHDNIYPVAVSNCPDGGDDLEIIISNLYAKTEFKDKLKLSSVNSLNWGRIMMQTVHYFYGYFRVVDNVGEKINMAVPAGAFGNLCAGSIARQMGLPVLNFIVSNNKNACLHRIFSEGIFSKEKIHATVSNAIDILIPNNFWRHLYFSIGQDASKIQAYMDEFDTSGLVQFEKEVFELYSQGFLSSSISDEKTLELIKEIFASEKYLFDPHGAVGLAAADSLKNALDDLKLICFATAHPSKFPDTIKKALQNNALPEAANHETITAAKTLLQKSYAIDCEYAEAAIIKLMESNWALKKRH